MAFRYSDYDVIVVGGGHAGIEASLAAARMGSNTLLITQTIDSIGRMSCNPSIGGISKGNIVREIDALGGEMGKLADSCMIQYRLLNKSRGPAVQSPRIQADKFLYAQTAKYTLEQTPNLHIYQDTVVDIVDSASALHSGHTTTIQAVITARGRHISARAVVLTTGTFLDGKIYIGEYEAQEGRLGEQAAMGLAGALEKKGFSITRLKTGTPCRILRKSVDTTILEEQEADNIMRPFSFDTAEIFRPHAKCYVAYTNEHTHEIIRNNFHRSPLFSGKIQATGARYCPSIEDKVRKFPQRERHQLYIEPEGLSSDELYINGFSSSLPEDVQDQMLRTIAGFEDAVITRPAYAVDYAVVSPLELGSDLQTHLISGLFTAGQINGTSGYEEAGGQGIIAGINAALYARSLCSSDMRYTPFILRRDEAYIGVMIDDLITQGVDEPYRMFTARAEYRLKLRHDTADERLTERAYSIGLQKSSAVNRLHEKLSARTALIAYWNTQKITAEIAAQEPALQCHIGKSFADILRDPLIPLELIYKFDKHTLSYSETVRRSAELDIRYAHYITAQDKRIEKMKKMETSKIPAHFNYDAVSGLSTESCTRLKKVMPETIGQASRIPGIRPSDIMVLMVAIK
ncbi:MAG: tRNA uridine-5-carboxymethylaminomethyl(34) synthesis enzyme MnmG [Treponema sp.]